MISPDGTIADDAVVAKVDLLVLEVGLIATVVAVDIMIAMAAVEMQEATREAHTDQITLIPGDQIVLRMDAVVNATIVATATIVVRQEALTVIAVGRPTDQTGTGAAGAVNPKNHVEGIRKARHQRLGKEKLTFKHTFKHFLAQPLRS
jgi:hypothetical protein